ncbi:MAG: TIM barrel protein [Clostridiaceae bacterium]|nr:TIM barrel protein [Clostridiaceae bacterium]
MKFDRSACIETLYTEIDFYDRIEAASNDGFKYIEFWSRDDKDIDKITELTKKHNIKVASFNGDADLSLVDPNQKKEYLEYLKKSVEIAKKLDSVAVTIHSNGLGDGGVVINDYAHLSDTVKICTMYDTLKECAKISEESGIRMNLEMLNITTDHVGNYLATTRMAAELTEMVGSEYIKILYDVYHMQLNEGSICDNISKYIDQIGHVHVADVPGRHEPGTGEINYHNVYKHLEKCGYEGIVGYELYPQSSTEKAVEAIFQKS